MARTKNPIEFQEIIQRLTRMADGLQVNGNDPRFPAVLREVDLMQAKQTLENARMDYERKQTAADLAYDQYARQIPELIELLGKYDSMLRGFYGKTNPILETFGTVTPRARQSRPKAEAKTSGSN